MKKNFYSTSLMIVLKNPVSFLYIFLITLLLWYLKKYQQIPVTFLDYIFVQLSFLFGFASILNYLSNKDIVIDHEQKNNSLNITLLLFIVLIPIVFTILFINDFNLSFFLEPCFDGLCHNYSLVVIVLFFRFITEGLFLQS